MTQLDYNLAWLNIIMSAIVPAYAFTTTWRYARLLRQLPEQERRRRTTALHICSVSLALGGTFIALGVGSMETINLVSTPRSARLIAYIALGLLACYSIRLIAKVVAARQAELTRPTPIGDARHRRRRSP